MNSDRNTPRFLGTAFLIVFIASVLSGSVLLDERIWSGSISENLVNISDNPTLLWINILGELVTSIGIVVLTVLLYVALHKQNRIIALVGLGLWLVEAITLVVSRIFSFSLLNVSQEFVKAGAPDSSYFQTLGSLYYESAQFGYEIHMVFFCLGGILWYYLFYKSGYIPRVLSFWGLATVCLVLINELLWFFDPNIGDVIILLAPYAPYELFLGIWLIVKGFKSSAIVNGAAKTDLKEIK